MNPLSLKNKNRLDDFIIGQHNAKKTIATAVYNHYKRISSNNNESDDVVLEKSNILLVGPTGTGKTLIAKTIADQLGVPFVIADATSLTEAGYVGEDVEQLIAKLIMKADGDIKKAEKGIVYIDEIDKIARKGENTSITRDVSGEGVQQALLKIIEGTVVNVPGVGQRNHPNVEKLMVDTKNILFICSGSFAGIERIINKRTTSKNEIGFVSNNAKKDDSNKENVIKNVTHADFIDFGIIPELLGRLPVIATLDDLTIDTLKVILTEPKNSIVKQYQKIFSYDNIILEFSDNALGEIAEKAIISKTGARGLRGIVEDVLKDYMFESPDYEPNTKILIDSIYNLPCVEKVA